MSVKRLPVFLLTGFLGSGKTTLLADWLRRQPLADTAVVINEAGEVQIDGALVGRADERIRVLEGGCICCTVLEDLGASIERLLEARAAGRVPGFSRILIETSGLADPAPVARSLMHDPRLQERVRYGGTLGVVDGVNGAANLAQYHEARAQLDLADAIILTKADLLDAGLRRTAEEAVRAHNPHARLVWSARQALADPLAERLLEEGLRLPAAAGPHHEHGPHCACHGQHRHSALRAHAFRFGQPIDGVALVEALDLMAQLYEGELVRSKALFRDRVTGIGYALHAVRGILDTPTELDELDDAATGVVIFTNTLSRERLAATLQPFVPVS
jgi:G3E family GTPase